jgi:hypothetical protein
MSKRASPSKPAHHLALLAVIALSATVVGCRGDQAAAPASAPATASAPPTASVPAAAPAARTKEQAMAALMSLPELQAWSAELEKSSGGKVRGALIEYDPKPKLIRGKNYWQFSFIENGSEAAHRWDSFLVAGEGNEILVEDFTADTTLTLEQWRKEKRPMERTVAE